jgi:outer membrane protein assembly factor BamB
MGKHGLGYLLFGIFLAAAPARAEPAGVQLSPFDWPQWRGLDRTAVSRETGLLKAWPPEGPPLVWKAKGLGGGYSAPSVAAGRVFGMSARKDQEVVWALEEATGKELWCTPIAARVTNVSRNEGPRCTPTVDGSRLYALGVNGDLVCLDTATGKECWRKNLVKDFGGQMMSNWGYSESPLVDGDKLVCTPGGKEATLVALAKKTGATVWRAQVPEGDEASYASCILAEVDGLRQYIQFVNGGVVSVAAEDGRFLWRYDAPASKGKANCATPVYFDHLVFASSAYPRAGAGLVRLSRQGGKVGADEVYFTKRLMNHHGGMVLIDGYLYGANGGNGLQRLHSLVCLDFKTGKVMWEQRRPGKGSIAYADTCLYYRNEDGTMFLMEATPKGYVERGRFEQPDLSPGAWAWSHPVLANRKLYLRDQDVLLCYDVKQH